MSRISNLFELNTDRLSKGEVSSFVKEIRPSISSSDLKKVIDHFNKYDDQDGPITKGKVQNWVAVNTES